MDSSDDGRPETGETPAAWQPTSADLMSAIEKASAARRADCPAFIEEFAEMYAAESTRDELDQTWVRLVKEYPWYAEDLLHCATVALADEERPLPRIIGDIAQLEAEGDDVERQLSLAELDALGREWLRDLQSRFRAVFDQLSAS